jgi:hypothetical protein
VIDRFPCPLLAYLMAVNSANGFPMGENTSGPTGPHNARESRRDIVKRHGIFVRFHGRASKLD